MSYIDIKTANMPGLNIFDKAAILTGFLLNPNNVLNPSSTSAISDFMPVSANNPYTISGRSGNAFLVYYDVNKSWLSDGIAPPMNGTITTPTACAFVRMNVIFTGIGSINTTQFQFGTTATTYQPYTVTKYTQSISGNAIVAATINTSSGISTLDDYMQKNGLSAQTYSNQAVQYINGKLTIATRYSTNNNVRIVMGTALANSYFCINTVSLTHNSGNITAGDLNTIATKRILDGTQTDLIGPYILNSSGFVSANHLVNGLHSGAMLSHQIFINGIEVQESATVYDAKEVLVKVKTEVYDYSSLLSTGTPVVNFNEYHTYRIVNGMVEVLIEQVAVRDCNFTRLYGIQNVVTADVPKLYVAHSAINAVQTYDNTANYGTHATYPSVEKAIYADANSIDCISIWLDRSLGLGANPIVQNATAAYLVSETKGYFWIIDGTKTLHAGDRMFYHGGYYPFKNLSIDPSIFAYLQQDSITKQLYLYVDFCRTDTGDKFITVYDPSFIGKNISVTAADLTVTITDAFVIGDGLTVKSTGYGNIKIKIL